jgi:hypothetical protein
MALVNPELLKLARFTVREGWEPAGSIEKTAIVPAGAGGDPAAAGGDPTAPPGGGAMPPPGADPGGGGGGSHTAAADPAGAGGSQPPGVGGPPPGPMDPAALQQIVTAVQQAMGGGAGGKGKSPKDQLQASQAKITIHLLAQIASKMGIQVDPQMLVPPSDPASDQMAVQELQNAPMLPSTDPNAQGAGGAPPGGAGGAPPGPGPIQPMDASQGPIGKAAGMLAHLFDGDDGAEASIGREYNIPRLQANRQQAAARMALLRSLAEG